MMLKFIKDTLPISNKLLIENCDVITDDMTKITFTMNVNTTHNII